MGNRWLIKLLASLFLLPFVVLADDAGAPDTGIQKDGTTVTTARIPFEQGLSMALDKNFWMDDLYSNNIANRIFTNSGNFTLNIQSAGQRGLGGRQSYDISISGGNGDPDVGGVGGSIAITGGGSYGSYGGDIILHGGPNLDGAYPGIVAVTDDPSTIPLAIRNTYSLYVKGQIFADNLTGSTMLKADASKGLTSATAGSDYENPLTFSYPLTRSTNTIGLGYNSTNLKLTTNQLNTIQDIATSSAPTFGSAVLSSSTAEKIKLQKTMSAGDTQEINYYDGSNQLGTIRFEKSASGFGNFYLGWRYPTTIKPLIRNDEDNTLYIDESGYFGVLEIGTSTVHLAGDLNIDGSFFPDKMAVGTNQNDITLNIVGKSMFTSAGGISYAGGLVSSLSVGDGGIMTSDAIYFVGVTGYANGEWRIKPSGSGSTSDLLIQKFNGSSWVTKSTIPH